MTMPSWPCESKARARYVPTFPPPTIKMNTLRNGLDGRLRRTAEKRRKLSERLGRDDRAHLVSLREDLAARRDRNVAGAAQGGDFHAAFLLEIADALPRELFWDDDGQRRDRTVIERRRRLEGHVHQTVADDFGAHRGGANGFDAQLAIELAARRVVDARDDLLDPEHALRDQCRHHVAVIAVRDGDESVGVGGAGAFEDVVVDAGPNFDATREARPQTFEGGRVFVDDDDVVALGGQEFGGRGAAPAAADDSVFHLGESGGSKEVARFPGGTEQARAGRGLGLTRENRRGLSRSFRGVAQLGRALGSGPRGPQVQILSPRFFRSRTLPRGVTRLSTRLFRARLSSGRYDDRGATLSA